MAAPLVATNKDKPAAIPSNDFCIVKPQMAEVVRLKSAKGLMTYQGF